MSATVSLFSLSVWLTAILCLCFLELGSAPHFTAPALFLLDSGHFALEGRYCDEFLPRAGRPYNITVCSFNRQRAKMDLGFAEFYSVPLLNIVSTMGSDELRR